jgi:hypothetical protein
MFVGCLAAESAHHTVRVGVQTEVAQMKVCFAAAPGTTLEYSYVGSLAAEDH